MQPTFENDQYKQTYNTENASVSYMIDISKPPYESSRPAHNVASEGIKISSLVAVVVKSVIIASLHELGKHVSKATLY